MITIKFFAPGFLLLLITCSAMSQTDSSDIKKIKDDLSKIFQKKDKTSNQQESNKKETEQSNNTSIADSLKNNSAKKTTSDPDQLKPGDVAPDAKYLDVDVMTDFNRGAALVVKGGSFALIDSSGSFVVPFNKYIFNDDQDMFKGTGLFHVPKRGASQDVFINSKGEKIFSYIPNYSYQLRDPRVWGKQWAERCDFMKLEEISYKPNGYITNFFNSKGERYSFMRKDVNIIAISEGLVSVFNNHSKWGYENLKDEFVIPPQFDEAQSFSEGFAIVGKINEFKVMKYGVIDKKGNIVIPFKFSKAPTPFQSGLSKVEPTDKSEFAYAFINMKGDIVIKQTLADEKKYGDFGEFENGYSYAYGYQFVMTTDGKIIPGKEFMARFGVTEGRLRSRIYPTFDGKILYEVRDNTQNRTGIIDVLKNSNVAAAFPLGDDVRFDPVSHLAHAKVFLGKNSTTGGLVYREGYINEQGIFVIVKSEGSKW